MDLSNVEVCVKSPILSYLLPGIEKKISFSFQPHCFNPSVDAEPKIIIIILSININYTYNL